MILLTLLLLFSVHFPTSTFLPDNFLHFPMSSKSGAQKRKEACQKIHEAHAKKLPKLTIFFQHNSSTQQPSQSFTELPRDEHNPETIESDNLQNEETKNNSKDFTATSDNISEELRPSVGPSISGQSGHHDPLNPFSKPHASMTMEFMKQHPIQPNLHDMPFSVKKTYYRKVEVGSSRCEILQRSWLSYSTQHKALFCSICLAYGDITSDSPFVSTNGFSDWKHTGQRVNDHEGTKYHQNSASAFLAAKAKQSVSQLLSNECWDVRNRQIAERRMVVSMVIDAIKFLAKQGLPARGHRGEALRTIDRNDINHGNFLELIKEMAKHNQILKYHLENSASISKDKAKKGDTGRGSFVSFLSSNTFSLILTLLADSVRTRIVDEVKIAGKYGLMVDSTQDVSTKDQCCVSVRYVVKSQVHEKMLALIDSSYDTTSQSLFAAIQNITEKLGIPLKDYCIADASDGASNLSGEYTSLQAKLREQNPSHIHTWCYSHVLNLVISSSCTSLASLNFFNLLQSLHTFFSVSYKRMAIWEETFERQVGCGCMQRLTSLGNTRWRAKHNAVAKIFGTYDDACDETASSSSARLYNVLVMCLNNIAHCASFPGMHRSEAKALQDKLLDYEIITTAFIYLRIFKYSTPLSDYLQTPGLDYVQAWRQVSTVQQNLLANARDFIDVLKTVNVFITHANKQFEQLEVDITVNQDFKQKPMRRKKQMFDEMSKDEVIADPVKRFEVEVHNVIMDCILNQLDKRFLKHKALYNSLEVLDPRNFQVLSRGNIDIEKFDGIRQLLPEIDLSKLQLELAQFAREWPSLKNPTLTTVMREPDIKDDSDENSEEECATDCLMGCLRILVDYNMFSVAYEALYVVYKTVLTLPITQVCCERCFSQLKIIKSRLRSSLCQENLEAYMLLKLNRQWTHEVDNLSIIQKMCETSKQFSMLL